MNEELAITRQDLSIFKEAIKKTTVEAIEDDTAAFIKSVFESTKKGHEWQEKWFEHVWSIKDTLTTQQLIAFVSNMTINQNDATSKALAPTSQLIVAKQQAETAKAQAQIAAGPQQNTVNDMNILAQNTDKEVLVGLTNLANLMAIVSNKAENIKNNAIHIDKDASLD